MAQMAIIGGTPLVVQLLRGYAPNPWPVRGSGNRSITRNFGMCRFTVSVVLVLASCVPHGDHAQMSRVLQPGIGSLIGLCLGSGSAAALAMLVPVESSADGTLTSLIRPMAAVLLCGAWAVAGAPLLGRPAALLLLPDRKSVV